MARTKKRSPERQERRNGRGRLGAELAILQNIPPKEPEAVGPERGEMFERAIDDDVKASMGPLKHKVFCLICAYADAGVNDPPMTQLAARATLTMPATMFLIRALELKGRLRVQWATQAGERNIYEPIFRDG
jgi:hypothetical protein